MAFGIVAFAVTPAAAGYVFLHVGFGFLLLVLWLTASRDSLTTSSASARPSTARTRSCTR